MITYTFDDENIYTKKIQNLLRNHNVSFTREVKPEELYIYALRNNELVGALTVYYFWDWVSIGDAFYLNNSILQEMINEVWKNYSNKAEGVKLFTSAREKYEDFLTVGFKTTGKVKTSREITKYYYCDLTSTDFVSKNKYNVISKTESVPTYQKKLDNYMKVFNKRNNINGKTDDFQIVAKDNENFVGGISCEIYDETLYISRIVVDEKYRLRQIGKNLMIHTEKEAIKREVEIIELGTCEFQAKEFYEKLGYKIVYTRDNYPRGYKSYTMNKELQ